MNNFQLYQRNLKEVYDLLSKDQYTENISSIRETFLKGYYEIIKICFDLNVDLNELERISFDDRINKEEIAKLVIKSVENDNSYIVMNEYLEGVIDKLEKNKK